MLSGRAAFLGEDVSDTLAAVIRGNVDWSALPAGVAPKLRDLLRRCLEKDPKKRYRDIGDVLCRRRRDVAFPSRSRAT